MRLGKFFLALAAIACPAAAHGAACPTGYTNVRAFVVPHQNVGSTLTSFPVLLAFNSITPTTSGGVPTATSFTLADLKVTGSGGKIQSSGNDIVFCDAASGGNLLNFDRAMYTGTSGAGEFYIGRTLSSTTDTYIWMFYGKASDTDHSAAAATWSAAGYQFVMHFGDGASVNVTDSSGSTTPTNHSSTATTTGAIAGAGVFTSASSQYVDAGASVNQSGGNITVEAWVKQSSAAALSRIVSNLTGSAFNGYELYINDSGTNNSISFQLGSANTLTTARATPAGAANGTWAHVTGVEAAGAVTLYGNGVSIATASGSVGTSSVNLNVGRWSGGASNYCNCTIDEVRVSTGSKSASWVAANYLDQYNPTGFAIMEDASVPAGMASGSYCVPLTVSATQVPNTDQTNFPLLVHGIYSWMADTANGGFAVVGNSAKDIRFYSNSTCTSTLNFQRIYWKNTTGDSSWRVRVPTVSHTSNTTIYVKIGSAADTTDLSTLWMASFSYAGVYAGSDPATLGLADSGVANLTLGCGATVVAAASPVGGGFYFGNSQSDLSTCGNALGGVVGDTLSAHGYATGSNAGHIRMWARAVPTTSAGGTFNDVEFGAYGKANGLGQRGFQVEFRATQVTGMQTLQMSNAAPGIVVENTTTTPTYINDLNWHLFDFDQPTNGATFGSTALYIDGVLATSPVFLGATSASVLNTDNTACCTNQPEVRIGRMAAHGVGWFNGFLGQFEATSFSLSADTVKARYNNELNPSTFYSFGTASPFVPAGSNQPNISVSF